MIFAFDQLKNALSEFVFPKTEIEIKIKSLRSRIESNQ